GAARVLEFNCRLGDPETQPIMMRLRSDLVGLCGMALDGGLENAGIDWDERAAVGVVLAAAGYPAQVRTGDAISGLDSRLPADVKIFHAATAEHDGRVTTAGGRVLCVTALGRGVRAARRRAYQAVEQVRWPGMFYRKDIGFRAVQRETDESAGTGGARN
ncbi:MAG: phosphoribosylamine--glycine ligase, partial [Gammaproteobacteria bacterium]|nr:phosphoribosylamine--glycine ligase [Gammaproteobacteria bacterium]